jgi:hypothetical protein
MRKNYPSDKRLEQFVKEIIGVIKEIACAFGNFTRGKVIPKRWVVELTKAEKKNADGFFKL